MNTKAAALFDTWACAGKGESMAKGHWPMVSQIIERMQIQPGMHCLDVGCGNGYAVRAMAQRIAPGGAAMGLDVSSGMIQQAQAHPENPKSIAFQVAPAEQLPLEADTIDRLLSVEVIYYLPDALAALKDWYRVLKPGGSVWIMVDYYRENPYCHTWGDLIEIPMQLYTERQYRELLERAGFTAVCSDRLFNTTPLNESQIAGFKPGWGYETVEDVVNFNTRVGSLLLSGKKSSLDIPADL